MIYSSILAYTLLTLFYPSVQILSVPLVVQGFLPYAIGISLAVFLSYYFKNKAFPKLRAEPFAILLFALFVSSLIGVDFTLFADANFKILLLLVGAASLLITYFLKVEIFSVKFLLLAQLLVTASFLQHTGDKLIFSDDHPSFLYRFQMLRDHFPFIPFYNAEWNAGYSAREFLPSGMLNVFFVAAPLIYLFPASEMTEIYNLLIPYLYVFIIPWSVYLSACLLGSSKKTAVLAALLALAPSLGYFEWLLKYGTLGFVFSVGMAPLTYALIVKLVFDEEVPSWKVVFGLLLVSFLLISWSLSGLIFIPAAVLTLVKLLIDRDKARLKKVLAFAMFFVLLNGPWVKVFIEESKVFSFVSGSALPGAEGFETKDIAEAKQAKLDKNRGKALKYLKASTNKLHPLIVILFIPALIFSKRGWNRRLLSVTIIWLVFVSYAGEIYKPQLELKRMLLPAAFLLCLPVAEFILWLRDEFIARLERKESYFLKLAPVLGITILYGVVVFTPLLAASAYSNRSPEKFVLEPIEFRTAAEAISRFGGEGRTFFAGFVLHELGSTTRLSQDGGHIAPLAKLSGKPLYASDFYHTKWSTVDPIPHSYRSRGPEGIEEFLDLINATAVITAKPEWKKYFNQAPGYRLGYLGEYFRVYERRAEEASYFLEGQGELQHLADGILVTPSSTESVLKFRYLPKLQVHPQQSGVSIEPVFAFEEEVGKSKKEKVYFIKLHVTEELLSSKSSFQLSYWQ